MATEFTGTQVGPDGRRYPIGTVPPLSWEELVAQEVRVYGQPQDGDIPTRVNGQTVWVTPVDPTADSIALDPDVTDAPLNTVQGMLTSLREADLAPPIRTPAIPGTWIQPLMSNTVTSSLPATYVNVCAIEIPTECRIDAFGFFYEGSTASTVNIAVYADDGTLNRPTGLPISPVARVTGFQYDFTAPVAAFTLTPGRYWVAFLITGAPPSQTFPLAATSGYPVVAVEWVSRVPFGGLRSDGSMTTLGDVAGMNLLPDLSPVMVELRVAR